MYEAKPQSPVTFQQLVFLKSMFFGHQKKMKKIYTLPKTNIAPAKMVVSKAGISKLPGGPYFQALRVC